MNIHPGIHAGSPKAVAIAALKSAGIWDDLDCLFVLAAPSAAAALADWKGTYTAVEVNSPTFTAKRGYAGNGSTSRVRTNYTPSTNAIRFTQNDSSAWCWSLTDAQATANDIGNFTAPRTNITTRNTTNFMSVGNNDASASAVANSESLGFFGTQRTGASVKKAWKNGVQLGSDFAISSTGLPTVEQWICGSNSGFFSTKQIAIAAWGASLTGKEATFYSIMRAYMLAVRAVPFTIAAMGDSFTFNAAYPDLPAAANFYPYLAETALTPLSCRVSSRNFGVAGNTTTQMKARVAATITPVSAGVCLIYGGINDPAGGIDSATTSQNLVDIAGLFAAKGYTRFMVLNQHYANLAAGGGDTLALESSTYAGIRTRQLNAYNTLVTTYGASNVQYVNLYSYMRNLINGVTYTDQGYEWHEASNDVHPNAIGEQIIANAVVASAVSAGWTGLLA